jgi:hypothetical protein
MILGQLEPCFLKIISDDHWRDAGGIDGADGIMFLCPICFEKNKGPIGTHSILCWQPHVPQTFYPAPGRWRFEGTGIRDLTLVAGSSSILLQGGCNAHFFVQRGEIRLC